MVNVAKRRLFSQACLGPIWKVDSFAQANITVLVHALIVKTALAYALIVLPWPKLTQLGKLKCLYVTHHRILKLKMFTHAHNMLPPHAKRV